MKPTDTIENRLMVRLGDGHTWLIAADREASAWVDQLSRVLGVPTVGKARSDSQLRMILTQSYGIRPELRELIPSLGAGSLQDLSLAHWDRVDLGLLHFWFHRTRNDVICCLDPVSDRVTNGVIMQRLLVPLYRYALDLGGLPLHAAMVGINSRGVLLVGSGGAGKSTSCKRLPSPWKVLSDDAALLLKGLSANYLGHPLPTWSDHILGRDTQAVCMEQHVQVTAIFFLEQAETDKVVRIGKGEAAALASKSALEILYQTWWNMEPERERVIRRDVLENACGLVRDRPSYRLNLSLDGGFWDQIESVLD